MLSSITPVASGLGVEPRTLILVGLFFGSLLVFLSLVSIVRDRNAVRVRARMRAAGGLSGGGMRLDDDAVSLFVAPDIAPGGLARAFLPSKQRERNKVRRDLVHAGFSGPNAVLWYYALRVVAGLLLPALVALTFLYREVLPLPEFVSERMGRVSANELLMLFAVMILVGFYGPAFWLSSRAAERKHRVELGFPNALDLMQVSIETGLGFDAALARVSAELATTAPEISQEFTVAQQEILAGRDREGAYHAMADRLAIDEAYALRERGPSVDPLRHLDEPVAPRLFCRNAAAAGAARTGKGQQTAGIDVRCHGDADDARAADRDHWASRIAVHSYFSALSFGLLPREPLMQRRFLSSRYSIRHSQRRKRWAICERHDRPSEHRDPGDHRLHYCPGKAL